MASLKYKTQNGYEPIPAQVVTKTNAQQGNGIGTCSTSSGTALVVTLANYELVLNGFIAVTFDHDVPASATLNVNGKGAKPIIYKGSAIEDNVIKEDDTVTFCYDGTNYVVTSLGGSGTETSNFIYGHIILDQTSSDPATKVLDMEGHGYSNYQRPEVITAIRNASHRYVGTFLNGVMLLKQLDDTDGTKYANGTSAATDITTQGKDVFMRLPYFFTRATEIETDKWKIEFAYDPIQTVNSTRIPDGENWKQWGGNDLIGVYEAFASDSSDNTTGGLYSRSGVSSSGSISFNNFKVKARNRGNGFTCVKWRHNCIMAILFYAYYGNTYNLGIVGSGSASYNKNTGLKNSLGMADTTSSNGNTDSINFWGLENWWGNKYEYIDNCLLNNCELYITEDDNSVRQVLGVFSGQSGINVWIYSSKYVLGQNLDTLPLVEDTNGSETTGYCGRWHFMSGNNMTVSRSFQNNSVNAGMPAFNADRDNSGSVLSYRTSRLAFIGTIQII